MLQNVPHVLSDRVLLKDSVVVPADRAVESVILAWFDC